LLKIYYNRWNLISLKIEYKYARAKLVITIRIHAALPCLALNTPVILVNKNFNKRFPGLLQFFYEKYNNSFSKEQKIKL